MPEYVQRRMTGGWEAPLDAEGRRPVYVGRGRGCVFGNPHRIVYRKDTRGWHVESPGGANVGVFPTAAAAAPLAVDLYRSTVQSDYHLRSLIRYELPGRDLMCWCADKDLCHSKVLFEYAAQGPVLANLAPSVLDEFDGLYVDIQTRGFKPVTEHQGLRVGARVRHSAELWDKAQRDGTGTIAAVTEKKPSAWADKYRRPDVEVIVLNDKADFGHRFTQLADYHVVAVEEVGSRG